MNGDSIFATFREDVILGALIGFACSVVDLFDIPQFTPKELCSVGFFFQFYERIF